MVDVCFIVSNDLTILQDVLLKEVAHVPLMSVAFSDKIIDKVALRTYQ